MLLSNFNLSKFSEVTFAISEFASSTIISPLGAFLDYSHRNKKHLEHRNKV